MKENSKAAQRALERKLARLIPGIPVPLNHREAELYGADVANTHEDLTGKGVNRVK